MNWEKKIIALLHDPIEKALNLEKHENIANRRLNKLGTYLKDDYKNPDYLSSAADRILFPKEKEHFSKRISINIYHYPEYLHPLNGEKLEDYFKNDFKQKIDKLNSEKITDKLEKLEDFKKTYYKTWWELPEQTELSFMLPGDTRIPSHSIIDHLDSASAMSVSNKMSLLLVSIGPVQEFIAAARKTIDLKVGSYMLSYLTFQGIKVIGEEYGYDNVIFPYMRGNYFVKKEFEKIGIFVETSADPGVASLPNIFTAIVPTKDLEKIKSKIKKAIKDEMSNISQFIKIYIEDLIQSEKKYKETIFQKLEAFKNWDKQISQFPIIITVDQEINNIEKYIEKHYIYTEDENIKKLYQKMKQLESTYQMKDIAFYGMYSELLGIKSSLRKTTRDFIQLFEDDVVNGDDLSGANKAVIEIIDKDEKKERLSALSAIKRLFVEYLNEIGYKEAYEKLKYVKSTEEIAGKYKLAVLLMDGDNMGKWISGTLAPSFKKRLHSKVIKELEREDKEYTKLLENINLVTPSYQRMISRTLNNFSNFVPKVVEEFDGLLIYAGGDDVLALFPSNKVFDAANKLRKVYSGIGEEKVGEYVFKNGWCYKKEKNLEYPVFNMMGKQATMSAGIVISKHNFNLKLALNKAREMEKLAKSNEEKSGRKKDSFAIATIRRSGQINISKSFWELNRFDILLKGLEFIKDFEKEKSIKNIILRLKSEYINYCFDEFGNEILTIEDFKNNIIPFLEKRMEIKKDKLKNSFVKLITLNERFLTGNKLMEYFNTLENIEYARRENIYEKN